jgi:hypothetical protein
VRTLSLRLGSGVARSCCHSLLWRSGRHMHLTRRAKADPQAAVSFMKPVRVDDRNLPIAIAALVPTQHLSASGRCRRAAWCSASVSTRQRYRPGCNPRLGLMRLMCERSGGSLCRTPAEPTGTTARGFGLMAVTSGTRCKVLPQFACNSNATRSVLTHATLH